MSRLSRLSYLIALKLFDKKVKSKKFHLISFLFPLLIPNIHISSAISDISYFVILKLSDPQYSHPQKNPGEIINVGIATGYGLERQEILVSCIATRRVLGSAQPPVRWVPVGLSLGVKRPGREIEH
jgi:hypothetical protein